ncbi:hypothetical protein BDU57DRAFT_319244 [Ampelomyces quisqualis]|uniref:Uncharacterized protein n=1 Tax=Ampelomyces quisqualis TaxID=50730 RepID=A0A6A5QEC6_AMPQU|nr:hypothetical protein BDU57DRAFT_319244 [Ampelomyces quisqualis]
MHLFCILLDSRRYAQPLPMLHSARQHEAVPLLPLRWHLGVRRGVGEAASSADQRAFSTTLSTLQHSGLTCIAPLLLRMLLLAACKLLSYSDFCCFLPASPSLTEAYSDQLPAPMPPKLPAPPAAPTAHQTMASQRLPHREPTTKAEAMDELREVLRSVAGRPAYSPVARLLVPHCSLLQLQRIQQRRRQQQRR